MTVLAMFNAAVPVRPAHSRSFEKTAKTEMSGSLYDHDGVTVLVVSHRPTCCNYSNEAAEAKNFAILKGTQTRAGRVFIEVRYDEMVTHYFRVLSTKPTLSLKTAFLRRVTRSEFTALTGQPS